MVNFLPYCLDCDNCVDYFSCKSDVYKIVEHINHMRAVAGVDHIGIGSDFSGIDR